MVDDGLARVLCVEWRTEDESDALFDVKTFLPGAWERRLFNIARPRLKWGGRRRWEKHQRRRAA